MSLFNGITGNVRVFSVQKLHYHRLVTREPCGTLMFPIIIDDQTIVDVVLLVFWGSMS